MKGAKWRVCYRMPVFTDGERTWETFEDLDTSRGIAPWPGEDYFRLIVQDYVQAGRGRCGKVGSARALLLDGGDLVRFAADWMTAQLGNPGPDPGTQGGKSNREVREEAGRP